MPLTIITLYVGLYCGLLGYAYVQSGVSMLMIQTNILSYTEQAANYRISLTWNWAG